MAEKLSEEQKEFKEAFDKFGQGQGWHHQCAGAGHRDAGGGPGSHQRLS